MFNNDDAVQTPSLPSPREDLGKWAWVDDFIPAIPPPHSGYCQDLEPFDTLQLNTYMAELTDLSCAGETFPVDPFAGAESMTGTFTSDLGGDMFIDLLSSGLPADAVGPYNTYATPQSSVGGSPTTPVYDVGCFPSPQIYQRDIAPPTPVSLTSATPEPNTSPIASPFSVTAGGRGGIDPNTTPQPAPGFWTAPGADQQLLTCPEPECGAVFAAQAHLRKHARKHRPRFRCPVAGAPSGSGSSSGAGVITRWCAGGFPDSRALRRHLWSHHAAYAREHGVPSERAQCPLCPYSGRGDNLARHMKRHGGR